jgi:S1-C subfamily serine protease
MDSNQDRAYPARRPRSNNRLAILLVILVVLVLFLQVRDWLPGLLHRGAHPRVVTARGELAPEEESTIALFKAASPCVVYITSLAAQVDLFSFRALEVPQGTGSGFIWDANGYIVTNYHVISEAQRAKVTLADGSTWNAQLVGTEPDKDIAVLKIDAPKRLLPPIPIGTSSDLQVGQKVFAIGNPFGFDHTLTTGIVSGLGREIVSATNRPIQGVIQTDAAINPGNSGGPLLDSASRIIGINTAILSPSGAYAGIGFAVPIDIVNRIVPPIIRGEPVRKPGLGITIADDSVVTQLGREGVLVMTVAPGGAAEVAGIRPTRREASGRIALGDFIVGIDGKPIGSTSDLFKALDAHEVGDTIRVSVQRTDQGEVQLEVKLQVL